MADERLRNASSATRDVQINSPTAAQGCSDVVHISVFFDGAGNNKDRNEEEKKGAILHALGDPHDYLPTTKFSAPHLRIRRSNPIHPPNLMDRANYLNQDQCQITLSFSPRHKSILICDFKTHSNRNSKNQNIQTSRQPYASPKNTNQPDRFRSPQSNYFRTGTPPISISACQPTENQPNELENKSIAK